MVLFHINAETLLPSEAFPYLGWKISYNNRNWAAIYLNLRKSRRRWGMIASVLQRKGATVRDRGSMYTAVEQFVLLYVSKSWLVTGEMLKVLTAFHHWVARRITGMTENRGADGEWKYPLVVEAIEAAGLHPIGMYINRR